VSGRETPLRLGGMALQNGLLVHGPTSWAVSVRDASGAIRTASGRKPALPAPLVELPLMRGVARIGELAWLLPIVRRALPEARLPFEQRRVGVAMVLTAAATSAARARLGPARGEAVAALAGLVPAAVAMRARELAGYHGAEHKAIGAYEHGAEAVDAAKEHERCGSHLVAPLLAASTLANAAVALLPERHRRSGRVVGSLAAIGMAVEAFAWMDGHRGSRLSRALQRPGFELQRLASTAEPTAAQLDVAAAALDALLRREERAPGA
jgi:uncharacterized protein YqhQ